MTQIRSTPGRLLTQTLTASIKAAASVVANDLLTYYKGNESGEIPGILPGPPPAGDYYWWAGGLLWDTLLEYSHRSGDDQFNDLIRSGLQWQQGPNGDYMPANWSSSMGNDDQAVWGLASLSAASVGLDEPKPEGNETAVDWAEAAQNVFREQTARRIANGSCENALRWQSYPFNNGYDWVSSKLEIRPSCLRRRDAAGIFVVRNPLADTQKQPRPTRPTSPWALSWPTSPATIPPANRLPRRTTRFRRLAWSTSSSTSLTASMCPNARMSTSRSPPWRPA